MTDAQLVEALAHGRLGEANEATRKLLTSERTLSAELVGRIAAAWSLHTDDLLGLSIQARAWKRIGGPSATGADRWELFRQLGKLIGWRKKGYWVCLPDSPFAADGMFPVLRIDGDPRRLPLGSLPFHDGLGGGAFSPRDCYGEQAWDDWAEVYRLVLSTGK